MVYGVCVCVCVCVELGCCTTSLFELEAGELLVAFRTHVNVAKSSANDVAGISFVLVYM